ncbi:S8 family serine peptidase [Streptomyces sp. NPDC007883]|uniref:S8 family serine peptidase n=1 Tax=Streptomyces sp. NPDC007883 TaxID=3155116 RepID=UPI0033D44144
MSQGNTGNRSARPQAWAKNVMSVGGTYHYDTLSRADDAWNGGASIGPAADGRIKPDLSNYYDAVHTTASGGDASYTGTFSGTSASAPITCGYAGLIFQMWADGVFDGGPGLDRDVFASRPHAATAKALLINSADQYAFTGTSHDLARMKQGWGTAGVGNLYRRHRTTAGGCRSWSTRRTYSRGGQSATYTLTTDGSQPLKATMVYTDPMGSPSAAQARVNDLTLKLTAPDGTVYWGNNGLAADVWSAPGGSANTIDTVENVFVQTPAAGTWTIEVIASQVSADGHVETPATDADFALVATGKVTG